MTQPSNEQNFESVAEKIGVLILSESSFPEDLSAYLKSSLKLSGANVLLSTPLPMIKDWGEIRETEWFDWIEESQTMLSKLRATSETIFILGISLGSSLAIRLGELFGADVDGLLIIEPSFPNIRRAHRKIWSTISQELNLIDQPLILMYSSQSGDESSLNALTITNHISSPFVREVILEISPDQFPIIVEEARTFMEEIVNGMWLADLNIEDDSELIDAEFQSIVEGLSLDESTPSNYLDSLDLPEIVEEDEHFLEPDPELLPIADPIKRNAIIAMVLGPIYAVIAALTNFDPFGVEPWPGVLAFLIGLGFFFYSLSDSRSDDTGDDGAIL